MADRAVANRHVRHLANRTRARAVHHLVLGSQENRKARLTEATPIILQYIALKEHALRVLQFKMILDREGMARRPADISRLALPPGHRLEEMIAADFDVPRGRGRRAATKQNIFAGGFQEIIHDLVCAALIHAATADRL